MNTSTRSVTEIPRKSPTAYTHPEWERRFPWLVQGVTAAVDPARAGTASDPAEMDAQAGPTGGDTAGPAADFRLFGGDGPAPGARGRWEALAAAYGFPHIVCAPQPHEATVRWYERVEPRSPEGGEPQAVGRAPLLVAEACDGHATDRAGLLLGVTVADCVPVFLVDPVKRAVALLHAGWRGTAAEILARGVEALAERAGSRREDLRVHLGPAICGSCYEVGPEVFHALGLSPPPAPAPVDVRAVLVRQAGVLGIAGERISISSFCTRCGEGNFFSHRGGDAGRQVAFLGIRRERGEGVK
ncbi:MAG: polyphenol oxidase family protein [Gemmatimonadota bacterium]